MTISAPGQQHRDRRQQRPQRPVEQVGLGGAEDQAADGEGRDDREQRRQQRRARRELDQRRRRAASTAARRRRSPARAAGSARSRPRPAAARRPPPSAGAAAAAARTARSAAIVASGSSSPLQHPVADRGHRRRLVEAQRRADGLEARRLVVAERDEQPGRRRRALHVRLAERRAEPRAARPRPRAPGARRPAPRRRAAGGTGVVRCAAPRRERTQVVSVTPSLDRYSWSTHCEAVACPPVARTASRSGIAHRCSSTITAAAVPGGIAAAAS